MPNFLHGGAKRTNITPSEATVLTTHYKRVYLLKIASPQLHTAHLTANDEALLRCQTALEQYDREDHEGALATMWQLWKGVGHRPNTAGLYEPVAAEVLLCAGVLTGWIGNKVQIKDAQEAAKNLISEAISYFDSVGDQKRVAAARVELAYCYWRDGEFNEARIMLQEALQKLTIEGDTRAKAVLKLTTIEWTSGHYFEALTILNNNAALYGKTPNHTTKGAYHSQIAIVLRNLATPNNRSEYFRRAVNEYKAADLHFKLARNPVYRADVKNNVGFLLYKLSRFKEAHKYLDEARRLAVGFKDKGRVAQIDETRAQVLIAERKFKEAEAVARKAVSALTRSGSQCLVADALITQGIALARGGKSEQAQLVFQEAIEVALQVDVQHKAGLAALALIEEISQLSPATLQAAYERAREWLSHSQSNEVLSRLNQAAGKFVSSVRLSPEDATKILLTKGCAFQEGIQDAEREMIRQALAQANGSVTHAARLLRLSYQGLSYIIGSRHKDLLKERSPIRRRSRKH
jgi:tetratricopeptide (TPR) repeat protein